MVYAIKILELGAMIGDPFLNYFALGQLFFVVAVLFYGIIAIQLKTRAECGTCRGPTRLNSNAE